MSANIPYSIASNAKDFLSGMVAEQASYHKDKAKAAKDISSFVLEIDKDLRSVYDKYIPNVHVIDTESFTNLLANRIAWSSEMFLDPNSSTDITLLFGDKNSKEYTGLRNVVQNTVKEYHTYLLAQQGGMTDPVAELNKLSARLFSRTRKLDNTVSARVLGSEFSSRLNKIFGNKAVLAAIDPKLGSSDVVYVFFSSSFNSITQAMTSKVYKSIEKYIRDTLGPDTLASFSIGKIVNAGHAAVVSSADSFVNTPAFASVLYGVGTGRSKKMQPNQVAEAAELFKLESKILDNYITVDKTFTSGTDGYGVLLSLGVTFTNIEDAELNRLRGATTEKRAKAYFDIVKAAPLSRSDISKAQATLMRLVFKNNPALGRSSRNIVEFIRDAVLAGLSGKKAKPEKTKTKVQKSATVKVPVLSPKSKSTVFKNAAKQSSSKVQLRSLKGQFTSVANLQNIINSQLQDVISANMGDGDSRNILNYRTGRFAASASVERISESRTGMLTAFYTYMKNPYQTFEPGYAQGAPASRSPKLLISKSIREIAATHVGNRMRAVSI